LACCFASAAHATIVTYTFQAKVSSITERLNPNGDFVDVLQSGFAGTPVAIGDIVTGSFRYDTSVALGSYQPDQKPGLDYRMYDAGTMDSISYVDRTTGLAITSQPTLNWLGSYQVHDSVPIAGDFASDFFSMLLHAEPDGLFATSRLMLMDLYGNAFQSAAVPKELILSAFQYATVGGSFLRDSDDGWMSFSADITSLERVGTDVPEPGSAALFAIAAAGLFGLRKTRRRA
jgi:hypothetical protein